MTYVETQYRRIISSIPHPDSIAFIEELKKVEPQSMSGMPPVVWDRAQGFQVFDAYGNAWIDFTSAVVLTNAGHANPLIGDAIRDQLDTGLWHNYCNPSAIRLRTVKAILEIAPPYLEKVFLLTTGSEAVECAIKLMRLHGRGISAQKFHIVSFTNSFHGRTMASQSAGGFQDQKEWMGVVPEGFHQIPFPECARCPWGRSSYENCGSECLERGLSMLWDKGLHPEQIAGVITETFQGPYVDFMPTDYVHALREWTRANDALLVFDEIQAGIGRTGRWFGYEHYGVEADLVCMGKGLTSCLPMSAVAGRARILDIAGHGEMSSTHTGNPLCCAAAIANIAAIRDQGMMKNAAGLDPLIRQRLESLRDEFPGRIGAINGRGLVWAVYLLDPQTGRLDPDLGSRIVVRCMELGLLMLSTSRGTLKLAPPLCITEEAMMEGLGVIEQAMQECLL